MKPSPAGSTPSSSSLLQKVDPALSSARLRPPATPLLSRAGEKKPGAAPSFRKDEEDRPGIPVAPPIAGGSVRRKDPGRCGEECAPGNHGSDDRRGSGRPKLLPRCTPARKGSMPRARPGSRNPPDSPSASPTPSAVRWPIQPLPDATTEVMEKTRRGIPRPPRSMLVRAHLLQRWDAPLAGQGRPLRRGIPGRCRPLPRVVPGASGGCPPTGNGLADAPRRGGGMGRRRRPGKSDRLGLDTGSRKSPALSSEQSIPRRRPEQ